jgi:PAS domain S-box-containing protein
MHLLQQTVVDLFDGLPHVMFCLKDRGGRYTAVNQAFVERTQCRSAGDVLGRTAADVFPAELADSYQRQDDALLDGAPPLRNELELILRSDGSLGWYLTTKVPVTDDGGGIIGISSVSVDLGSSAADVAAVPALAAVVDTVRRHCTETIRVVDLAEVAGMSVRQLERNMQRVFGLSAKQFALRARLEVALRLLGSEDVPLAAIAAQCGYYDQAAFTRQFKRVVGMTPGQYRTRISGNGSPNR